MLFWYWYKGHVFRLPFIGNWQQFIASLRHLGIVTFLRKSYIRQLCVSSRGPPTIIGVFYWRYFQTSAILAKLWFHLLVLSLSSINSAAHFARSQFLLRNSSIFIQVSMVQCRWRPYFFIWRWQAAPLWPTILLIPYNSIWNNRLCIRNRSLLTLIFILIVSVMYCKMTPLFSWSHSLLLLIQLIIIWAI